MAININHLIKEAMARGDFNDLPGKGKPLELVDNPFIPREVRMMNQMLKDNGCAPRWIELDKEIRAEDEQVDKLLANIKGRRERLTALIRRRPLKHDTIRGSFELERTRALETHTSQLKTLNIRIQRFNLIVPGQNRQQPLHNLDAAIAHFYQECPGL